MTPKKRPKSVATDVTRECIAVRLRMANRVVTKIYDDALRPFGLRIAQMSLLAFAESQGLLRQSEICAQLQLDSSTLSRNLERMRMNGWLRETPGEDCRAHPYQLTATGRKLLRKAMPAWVEAQEKARALLGEEAVAALWKFAKAQGVD